MAIELLSSILKQLLRWIKISAYRALNVPNWPKWLFLNAWLNEKRNIFSNLSSGQQYLSND